MSAKYWVKYDDQQNPVGVRTISGQVIPDQDDPSLQEVTEEEYTIVKRLLQNQKGHT